MDFFKAVFSDDLEPADSGDAQDSPTNFPRPPADKVANEHDPLESILHPDPSLSTDASNAAATWGFGGFVKTLVFKSESVIQTYRRDLEEFRSWLKQETAMIRDAAQRAVKELPVSLEAGASVAQGSLESVGQAVDDLSSSVWRGAAAIVSHSEQDSGHSSDKHLQHGNQFGSQVLGSKRYSRFDAQLRAIQRDLNTYCEEPEDASDFSQWKLGFLVDEKVAEIENLLEENPWMQGIYEKMVPNYVDNEGFWSRYFYRVHKVKQAEDARVNFVKRAISGDDELLSWDVDDDDAAAADEFKDDRAREKTIKEKNIWNSQDGSSEIETEENYPSWEKEICEQNVGILQQEAPETKIETESEAGVKNDTALEEQIEERKPSEVETGEKSIGNLQGVSSEMETMEKKDPTMEKEIEQQNCGNSEDGPSEIRTVEKDLVVAECGGDDSGAESLSAGMIGEEDGSEAFCNRAVPEVNEGSVGEGKAEAAESSKDSDVSIVSTEPSLLPEEEALSWDEIEDVGIEGEDGGAAGCGFPNKTDLFKRLSLAEEDEDLSWDIEDDDEPIKS